MQLVSGARLGPYEIATPIGVGGMGEVYRATDTNLKRAVAIKVLPASVSGDPDRLARFQREAEILAALNHPNIAAIYGLEKSDGATALVMELVDGPTLADRIAQGTIPIDEALPIAKQIAEALEAAHERGIIHRDLKPANVKVRSDGAVKVLDFGLAAVTQESGPRDVNATNSPTLTLAATRAGVIMGTAAYMSPEQASGKPVDKRADIWSFGVVLWEMLTGERLFEGETISHTLAFVLTKEPDWGQLPVSVPEPIHHVLRRCLEKAPRRRLADIADARFDIEEAAMHARKSRGVSRKRFKLPALRSAPAATAPSGCWPASS
jgi:eukaryotic-like serine/threonine-protein kinase